MKRRSRKSRWPRLGCGWGVGWRGRGPSGGASAAGAGDRFPERACERVGDVGGDQPGGGRPSGNGAGVVRVLKAAVQTLAENNLAYVLMLEGSPTQLAEAEKLARAAIAKEPGISTLYDTLCGCSFGRVRRTMRSRHSCALERNATNVDAMIGLAECSGAAAGPRRGEIADDAD